MDTTWSVLAALTFGILLGAGFTVVLHMAERRGQSAARVVAPTIPDGVDQVLDVLESAGVVLDPSNNVLRASPGALVLGLVRNQMLVHPELVELVASVRRTGEPIATELDVARGPFSDATMRLAVRVARLGTRFVLLLADDRTEAHRLDEVRRDFIANISHELKTPIASVSLLAEALDHAADEPEQVRRFAHRLSAESKRLGHITGEVIELSRLQARDALRPDVLLDVDRIVAAAVDQNRVVAAAKGVEVRVRAKSRAEVYGDEALLVVAVHNLVANAIAYSSEGGRVGVGVRVDGDAVEISVADQGIGIATEDLDRVFERFYRVDQARSRNTGGSGLGLSIVKHTVQNHGGDVRVWSRPGKGSTFTIRLPLAERPVPVVDATAPADEVDAGASVPSAPAPVRAEPPARIAAALPSAPARGDTE
ncbi:two-component system sensor histidine kinase SenX3 [Agromyces flavus]|uniref:Sensor-like histidine kinase SenX3 n=1 Tax=Agromyces flavus TaxID=589382 RepID=A0A1H1M7I0_9MICO|nr:ATP-binding protein [Agromyces flavus]MCP2368726.1 two-component system sensor histidine kinase SenX3 [Agromyces flavus]GGI48036.1 two-component sensor histidine kinase [Agromyces flavus]SDR82482.1 two-component system, OmpR family, sensor histidine kinase SenX3 [Agromyces flavus]